MVPTYPLALMMRESHYFNLLQVGLLNREVEKKMIESCMRPLTGLDILSSVAADDRFFSSTSDEVCR